MPELQLLVADTSAGERAAIAEALRRGGAVVLIDDQLGRRAAVTLGLRVVGTLGVLGLAKSAAAIATAAPLIDELVRAGYRFSPALIRQFLLAVGEAR